jgi:ATP-dependent DNA helicase RecG
MTGPTFDLTPFLGRDEGQHFDRKSMFEGEDGKKRPRDRRKVRDQVAEQVAGFANAEGGVLILGIEDDHRVTGHQLPPAALAALLDVPRVRLHPAQPPGFVLEHDGYSLIVFDVPNCDVPVRVEGDGFPLRIGDKTMQVSESHIQKLKFRGLVESWESRPSHLRLADLDPVLLERARRGAGLIALTDEEYLLKRKLADHRGRDLVLRQAAELLFAKNGPDHPNGGFRLFRVVGTERKVGAEHNVEERPRFEGNLPTVIEECFSAIEGILRRPARLVGHRFRTVSEYPEFSWKEAIVNAAAHRDYNVEGRTTEIWFFDDRLEVVSPGGLLPDVNLEELLALHRIHVSRNPRTVRVLVDLGVVRDQGEGIPRMFAEMEGFFLPAPVLDPRDHLFRVTLRNTATLTADDKSFVARLGDAELTDVEFRALLEAHRAGRLDNARLRAISGLDTLGASALLRRLRDRELLALHAAGPNSYYEVGPKAQLPSDAQRLKPGTQELPAEDTQGLSPGTQGFEPDAQGLDKGTQGSVPDITSLIAALPDDLRLELTKLGPKPAALRLRKVLLDLCALRWWTPRELVAVLGLKDAANLSRKHLWPLVSESKLERRYPDNPAHPQQAYRVIGAGAAA